MDLETIKRINREALRAAQEAEANGGSSELFGNQQMMSYGVALAIAALTYFLLYSFKPKFVMSMKEGVETFDQMRAILSAVAAGLLVILAYQLF